MTRLIVSEDAEADLDEVLAYLQREAGERTAGRYAASFRAEIDRLLEFPGSGAPRPLLGDVTRIAIVYPYILIYDYIRSDETLTLLRIIHGKRNITKRLIKR